MTAISIQQIIALPAGTVIRVNEGWYNHVALMGDRYIGHERSVLAFSAKNGGFVEQPFSEFANGRTVTVDGYLSALPPVIVMQRARQKQGHSYSYTDFNCEHFVRYAHGVSVESPQLQQWVLLLSAVGLLTLASSRG